MFYKLSSPGAKPLGQGPESAPMVADGRMPYRVPTGNRCGLSARLPEFGRLYEMARYGAEYRSAAA